MKNKMLKIMSILVVVIMVVMSLSNIVMAADTDLLDPTTVSGTKTDTSDKASSIVGDVLGIVQVIAIGIAVIMLVVLAIKYISAAPAEKADIKKGLTIYIVGAVLLFGASGILQIIKTFAGTI